MVPLWLIVWLPTEALSFLLKALLLVLRSFYQAQKDLGLDF
jgi:hypothetical protein